MRIDLSAYPHDGVPAPHLKVALDYCDDRKRIRLDIFGDCFPGGHKGVFQDGFLVDASMQIWDAESGALRALRMIIEHVRCDIEPSPFSVTTSSLYIEFVVGVLDACPDVYLFMSNEIKNYLNKVRQTRTEKPNLSLLKNATLLDYQKEALQWMIGRTEAKSRIGILALEQGLGKTLVSLAYVAQHQVKVPYAQTLVICPASVIGHWKEHIVTHLPSLKVAVIAGTQEKRKKIAESGLWDIAITSVKSAMRDRPIWGNYRVDTLIFDEITAVKNRSKTRSAVKRFRAEARFGLTGTPIHNSTKDMYGEIGALDPAYLGTVRDFNRMIARPIEEKNDPIAAEAFRALVKPVMFRRLKQDLMVNLPAKIEREVIVNLDPEQMELYHNEEAVVRERLEYMSDEQFNDAQERAKIYGAISRLRQLAVTGHTVVGYKGPSTKLDLAVDMACSLIENGEHEKVVIFSLFVKGVVEPLIESFAIRGYGCLALTGAVPVEERQKIIEQFANDLDTKAIVISGAGGQGVNLQAANCVIVLSPWWNTALIEQGIDRVHRLGQEKDVLVIHLLAKDTIEERMVELQRHKRDLAGTVLKQPERPLSKMTRKELIELLGSAAEVRNRKGYSRED